jgi:hypothetical protein
MVDITYLPNLVQEKIRKIFDRYFEFGIIKYTKEPDRGEHPAFPNKISSLSSPDLGDLQGFYAAWYGFTLDKLKYMTVCKTVIDGEVSKILDEELSHLLTEKGNVDLKESKAKTAAAYVGMVGYKIEIDALQGMLKQESTRYENQLATISREISRREHNAGF